MTISSHLLPTLSFLLFVCCLLVRSEFHLGKVPPSEFDLPDLNGFYKPLEAAALCEGSPICAGFTYRGLRNYSAFPERKYEVYFFRYIHYIDDEAENSNWVTYTPNKLFAVYNGVFSGNHVKYNKTNDGDYFEHCQGSDCAALTLDTRTNTFQLKLTDINLNMDDFVEVDYMRTFVNLNVSPENVRDTMNKINLCCPAHTGKLNITDWIYNTQDTLERISCDTSVEDFINNYILPRKPVMLTGCIDDWKSTKTWTYENLLQRFGDDVTWKADVSLTKDSPVTMKMLKLDRHGDDFLEAIARREVRSYDDILLPGQEILDLMRLNATIRVFERVGKAPRREKNNYTSTYKPDLFSEWGWPKAIPEDLYKPSFGGSDYQWVIMSQPQTGTHIHHDPDLTDAWNALLYGHKYWVIFPKDVNVQQYECDDICSNKFDDLYAVTWYTHVLSQLRKETWYGQGLIETIQKPGEIIYVPHGQGHGVLNLDENLSVTENFLAVSAIDELAKFHAYNWNPFHFDSEKAALRVWTNLMNRDLKDKDHRMYAKEMLKQVRLITPPPTSSFEHEEFVPMPSDTFGHDEL